MSILPKPSSKSKDNELIYLAAMICTLLEEVESMIKPKSFSNSFAIRDSRIAILIESKDKWKKLFSSTFE